MAKKIPHKKKAKIDPLIVIAAIAAVCGLIYGILQKQWGPLVVVVFAFILVFCFRALIRDMYDEKAKTEGSEAYICGFTDPVEIKLICPKDTYGTNPFYVYCEGSRIAKIARGDELMVMVPRGRINLGLIRVDGMVPKKYALIDTDTDFVVYVYPDRDDSMLAYKLYAPTDEYVDETEFIKHYEQQKNGSVRISTGVLIGAIIITVVVFVFFNPFR